ncbi:MAG: hypothetical protein MZV49_15005 [Rhodopseudomonas palustris]|nr:hypothetical protein [Rhodopseudomonas palustris]
MEGLDRRHLPRGGDQPRQSVPIFRQQGRHRAGDGRGRAAVDPGAAARLARHR